MDLQQKLVEQIFKKHKNWPAVLEVGQRLIQNKHKAYLAGGCVRDALMGRVPNDFDLATEASPEEVQKIFPNHVDLGIEFGVVLIPIEEGQVEITSFRSDEYSEDGRRPTRVTYSSEVEDSSRRDFRINSMFYDLNSKKLIDYQNGQEDLKNKVLQTVGDPNLRFKEDHLRILRLVRFEAQLGFSIESETLAAAKKMAQFVSKVSKERIQVELKKIFIGPYKLKSFQTIGELGLWPYILPNFNFLVSSKQSELLQNTLNFVSTIKGARQLELGLFSFIFAETQALKMTAKMARIDEILNGLNKFKWPKEILNLLKQMQLALNSFETWPNGYVEALEYLDTEAGALALSFYSDQSILSASELSQYQLDLAKLNNLRSEYLAVLDGAQKLPKALVTGRDLIENGFKAGPEMGEMLNDIYEKQLKLRIHSKTELLEMANLAKNN